MSGARKTGEAALQLTSEQIALLTKLSRQQVILIAASTRERTTAEDLSDQGLVRPAGLESPGGERHYVLSGRGLRLAERYAGSG